jgi:hypothetical protein
VAQVGARSVSRQVKEWLEEELFAGVLAVHSRVCNLVTDRGEVIVLVAPEIGDGPLNVVLAEWPAFLSAVQAGTRVTLGPDRLVLGGIEILLDATDVWEPCPIWQELRARRKGIEAVLGSLASLCLDRDPGHPLLSLLGVSFSGKGLAAILAERFREAAGKLEAGWRGDENALVQASVALAGLGDGLTPAGDDFLIGAMLWAWLAHPCPKAFCRTAAEAAAPRTTVLSAAFLRAAARGQCGAAWHRLLDALAGAELTRVEGAARQVLAFGASSGLDALIGFLYLAQKGDGWQ